MGEECFDTFAGVPDKWLPRTSCKKHKTPGKLLATKSKGGWLRDSKGEDTSCDSLGPERVEAKLGQILDEEGMGPAFGCTHSWQEQSCDS